MPKRKKDDIEKDKQIRKMGRAWRKDIESEPYIKPPVKPEPKDKK